MSIALIIILVIAFALVVGPVAMMRPNPAQKKKEKLRLMAREKGVHYSMRNIPRLPDQQEQPEALPVYFLPPPKTLTAGGWMLVRTNYQHDIHFLGAWAWQGKDRASPTQIAVLEQQLPSFPESIRAVSMGSEGICVFWEEKGGEVVLKQILELLEALHHTAKQH